MKISQIPPEPAVPHRVAAAVPVVEVADHAHPPGVRGPDGEVDAPEPLVRRSGGRRASRSCGSASPRPAGGGRSRSGPGRTGRRRRTPRRAPRGSRRRGGRGTARSGRGGSASKKPSGWTRSIGARTPGSPLERSTTQAFAASGRKARTTRAGLPPTVDLVLAEHLERVPVVGVDDPVDVLGGSPVGTWRRRHDASIPCAFGRGACRPRAGPRIGPGYASRESCRNSDARRRSAPIRSSRLCRAARPRRRASRWSEPKSGPTQHAVTVQSGSARMWSIRTQGSGDGRV